MNKTVFWIIAAILIIAGISYYFGKANAPVASSEETTEQVADSDTGATADVPAAASQDTATATVAYDGSGFSPSSVTVKVGDSVSFTSAGGGMWVASAAHPTHIVYDGTSKEQHCVSGYGGSAPFDQCVPGGSYIFKFDKAGTWNYHDHMNASARGTVIVQ